MKLRITLEDAEIYVLCLMVKTASNTTFVDLETKAEMLKLTERIRYAVRSQAPKFLPYLEDLGDF